MNLPSADQAIVDSEKVSDYLLNSAHPDNGGKAHFFETQGFVRSDAQELVTALRGLAREGDVIEVVESIHGRKYIVDGRLETPSKKGPLIRSVWIVDRGAAAPRLVTAYPRDE